jgi:redox-sensitive bicupin YhaK (pirin superfamily)
MTRHQTLFLPANSRKFKDFGFMQAYLSFKPDLAEERHSFGSLITIDDAILKPDAKGFGLHSHQNVEVVTFVVQGEVKHIDPDNPLHTGTLNAKGIQVITAGTGSFTMRRITLLMMSCTPYKFGSNPEKMESHQTMTKNP